MSQENKPLLRLTISSGSKIEVHNKQYNSGHTVVTATDNVRLNNGNVYFLPIDNKNLKSVDFINIIVNPEIAHLIEVLSVFEGKAIVNPICDGVELKAGALIGMLV